MPRPKTLLTTAIVDTAGKSHNCQHNAKHRIQMGEKRLKVRVERSHEHFCVACAKAIIERDIGTLAELSTQLD